MSSSAASPLASAPIRIHAVTEARYTICPVLVASNLAVELGWLEEEIKKSGASLTYLRALGDSVGWLPHFSHKLDNFFRDGGNIPAIWAKSGITDTTLLGLTAANPAGQIVVRVDSKIRRVADLRGRRLGLYRSLNRGKVDFWRATAERGYLVALALHGLSRHDVEFVDLDDTEDASTRFPKGSNPAETFKSGVDRFAATDVQALAERRVDAIFTYPSRSRLLEATGDYTVIEDLDLHPDWTVRVANSPLTLTVNTQFANEHPEVVVAYLRAAIRAGRWANAHPDAAAEILSRVAFIYPDAPSIAAAITRLGDVVPNLSIQNIAGLGIQKRFLLEHGYIDRDFDIGQWAAPRFLDEALRSL
ncbi:MAG: ABC transporter substrate-binding protein [Opitutaceae bacterium]|nr:ABC transporter substrate-binding protein [Opitutaceae bacterium]